MIFHRLYSFLQLGIMSSGCNCSILCVSGRGHVELGSEIVASVVEVAAVGLGDHREIGIPLGSGPVTCTHDDLHHIGGHRFKQGGGAGFDVYRLVAESGCGRVTSTRVFDRSLGSIGQRLVVFCQGCSIGWIFGDVALDRVWKLKDWPFQVVCDERWDLIFRYLALKLSFKCQGLLECALGCSKVGKTGFIEFQKVLHYVRRWGLCILWEATDFSYPD